MQTDIYFSNYEPPQGPRRIADTLGNIGLALELLLVLRLVVQLWGLQGSLAQVVSNLTNILVSPFNTLLPSFYVGSSYIEGATGVAFLVYLILSWVVIHSVDLLRMYYSSKTLPEAETL